MKSYFLLLPIIFGLTIISLSSKPASVNQTNTLKEYSLFRNDTELQSIRKTEDRIVFDGTNMGDISFKKEDLIEIFIYNEYVSNGEIVDVQIFGISRTPEFSASCIMENNSILLTGDDFYSSFQAIVVDVVLTSDSCILPKLSILRRK